jgi:hypothetical protein
LWSLRWVDQWIVKAKAIFSQHSIKEKENKQKKEVKVKVTFVSRSKLFFGPIIGTGPSS